MNLIRNNWLGFLIILGVLIGAYTILKPDKWDGFFYKNGDFDDVITVKGFKDFDSCRMWAKSQTKSASDDFECGKNCKSDEYGMNICKETRDY